MSGLTLERRQLLVRVDDAGASLAANDGCLQACLDGIGQSIEVMMPGAWVLDAAAKFAPHPELDIGIHLTLTSEWDAVKWRPLTSAPSLVGAQGFFKPLLVPRYGDRCGGDPREALMTSSWLISEVEAEFCAQIELGLALFPNASHLSSHMTRHFGDIDARLGQLLGDLSARYGLLEDQLGLPHLPLLAGYAPLPRDSEHRVDQFIESLKQLAPGTSIFVDHPAVFSDELQAMGHEGYEDVAQDRSSCLAVLTDPRLAEAVEQNAVQLISYRDLSL